MLSIKRNNTLMSPKTTHFVLWTTSIWRGVKKAYLTSVVNVAMWLYHSLAESETRCTVQRKEANRSN